MKISIFLTSILLLPVIYCNKDHHEDHDKLDNKIWMQFLPNHVQHILKSRTTTTVNSDESSSSIEDSTETLITGEITNSSAVPEIMYGNSSSSSNSVPIGVSIGGIILFFCICYCCFKCCCSSRETISQGVVIHQPMQPPLQDPNQPNIVIQHIHATPHLQPVQPGMVQHVHHTHAPPQMVQQVNAPQFQQPPPYPTGYETRQMLQQEWSPHAPMNQQQPYAAPDYPYNPSAPASSYGKY